MISIIICSIDPGKFAAVSRNLADRLGDAPFEIIGIHDARSLSEAYNRGIARSRGDILIFCHDDIEILTPDFHARICSHLQTYDMVGCAGTSFLIDSKWAYAGDPFIHGIVAYPEDDAWPANRLFTVVWGGFKGAIVGDIQALDGLFLAANRRVLDAVRFDDATFDGFHLYDIDFSYAAHLAGFKLAIFKDIVIVHQSHGNFGDEWTPYADKFMQKYQGRLPVHTPTGRKVAVAKHLDRAEMLHLCEKVIGSSRA
jgi:GT2 family glycosyltransferase